MSRAIWPHTLNENLEKITKALANALWGFLIWWGFCGGIFSKCCEQFAAFFLHFQVTRSHITQNLKGGKQSDSVITLNHTSTPWHNSKQQQRSGGGAGRRREDAKEIFK